MATIFISFASLFLSVSAKAAIGPTGDMVLTNKWMAPDGFNRSAIEFGSLIKANVGDDIRINVINKLEVQDLEVVTSIHWHGINQRGTAWADGAAMVTQCPIVPGESFEYAFMADKPGTFWYHSHYELQYCYGLRGPLVIYNPNDPYKNLYDVDDESTIITLADWYQGKPKNGGTPPDSTLINGVGRSPGNHDVALAVVNVEAGKQYRFRLVSMACKNNHMFKIEGHSFTVIEADREYTDPLEVSSLRILAGQRYSLVMTANQKVGNYWIHSLPDVIQSGNLNFDNGLHSAILHYKGAPLEDPKYTPSLTFDKELREENLHVMENPAAPGNPTPGGADINIRLDSLFNRNFQINGTPFKAPTLPTLPVMLQILSGSKSAQELLPKNSVIPLERNKVVELVLPALDFGGPHPLHLHGHAFSVVRSAGSTSYNFKNPVRRDVVSLGRKNGSNDEVTIRFTTDNPGPWFLHCHIDFHLREGFAVVFAEDVSHIENNAPPAWNDLCPKFERFMQPSTTIPNTSQSANHTSNPAMEAFKPADPKGSISTNAPLLSRPSTTNTSLPLATQPGRHVANPSSRRCRHAHHKKRWENSC